MLACRPPEVVHDTDGLGSGCVLCHEPDFLRGAFGDRTIIICDTCEREFHVGCLREQNRADLKEVREPGGVVVVVLGTTHMHTRLAMDSCEGGWGGGAGQHTHAHAACH